MRLSRQQLADNEAKIRTAMPRLLDGDIPPGGKCDIKTLAGGAGVDRTAFAIAERAKTPFGAVLLETSRSTIAYTATNKRLNGPFAHAELNVLRSALRQRVELGGLVLVSTAEPCPMCAGAAILAQVSALVFGTSITTLAKRGGRQIVVPSTYLAAHYTEHPVPVTGGVLAELTDQLFPRR